MDNSGLTVAAAFGGDEQTLVSWSTHRSRRACEVWSPELFISLFKIYPLSRVLPGHFPDHVIVLSTMFVLSAIKADPQNSHLHSDRLTLARGSV